MNWRLVARLLGLLSLLVGAAMLMTLPWSFAFSGEIRQNESQSFTGMLLAVLASVAFGVGLWLIGRRAEGKILRKEALAVVGFGWLMSAALGALPYLLTPTFRLPGVPMSVADAFFESASGFSTTGASVLTNLEVPPNVSSPEQAALDGRIAYIPRSVLFWRSLTHWLGGMGIIVLFVAILGQLGAGGKALMRREVPGPLTDSVRPRIRETAVVLWGIYVCLSVVLTGVFLVWGMSLFDSLCHTFGTLATGGFSTRNSSVGTYGSVSLEVLIIVFMVIAGTNFNLYYLMIARGRTTRQETTWDRLRRAVSDPEFRTYLSVIGAVTFLLTVILQKAGTYTLLQSLRHSLFNTVTVITTTGFGTEDFAAWPYSAQAILVLLMFVGGSSGSTGGGVKVIRYVLLAKILAREAERSFRPNLVRPIQLAGKPLPDSVPRDVTVYFCLIAAIFGFSWLGLVALEPAETFGPPAAVTTEAGGNHVNTKLIDCAAAVASSLNNIGPGLGICGPAGNYTAFSTGGKLLLSLLMLLGRLELFALLVLFVPAFWRHH